jgi:hypothetical protein
VKIAFTTQHRLWATHEVPNVNAEAKGLDFINLVISVDFSTTRAAKRPGYFVPAPKRRLRHAAATL